MPRKKPSKPRIKLEEPEAPKSSSAVLEVYPGREEWLAARGLGGSDIAAIVGVSKWDSQFSLWCKRKGITVTKDNKSMRRGRRLEPVVIAMYEEENECEVWREKFSLFRSKKDPMFHASVDGLVLKSGTVLNAKTARYKDKDWGEDGTDVVPVGYIVSAQWEMGILGKEWKVHNIPALFAGEDFFTYVIKRDEPFIRHLFERARKFDKLLKGDEPPKVDDGLEETRQALLAMYPKPVGEIVPANKRMCELIEEREKLLVELKERKDRQAVIDNALYEAIGDNLGMSSGPITYRWDEKKKPSSFDKKTLEKDEPKIFAKYHRPGGMTRQLNRKEIKSNGK